MKPPNKNSPVTPAVAQLKTRVSGQSFTRPVAPPAYRPQPIPRVLQTKTSPASGNTRAETHRPIAVYRPQPMPRVLQTKTPPVTVRTRAEAPRQANAPAVYRPEVKKIFQPQPASLLRGRGNFKAVQCSFEASGSKFPVPYAGGFSMASALAAVTPSAGEAGELGRDAGREAKSGVEVGDVGSYAVIQWLEKVGDGLTGDHQPSGAAIKEAIREALHAAMPHALTRGMARNAYKKAVTVVVTDAWHKVYSRTYGGRNTTAQIMADASNLAAAAMADWKMLVPELKKEGWTEAEMRAVWDALDGAREEFYKTGEMTLRGLND